jgi:hypothetical protein
VRIGPEQQAGHEGQPGEYREGRDPEAEARIAAAKGVGEPSPQPGARGAGEPGDESEPGADLAGPQVMDADQEGRRPGRHAVARERGEGRAEGEVAEAPQAPEEAEHLAHPGQCLVVGASLREASQRLPHREAQECCDHDARKADGEEGRAPVEDLVQPAAGQVPEGGAEVDARGVHGQGRGAPLGREVVREQRVGGRAACGLADAHPDAGEGQLREALGQTREGGHGAPQDGAGGDHAAPWTPVGEAGDRDPGERVEDREGEAGEQPHRSVGHPELLLDRLDQDVQDLAIHEVEHVNREQERQHPVRVGAGRRFEGGAPGARRGHGALRSPGSRGCAPAGARGRARSPSR